jgi:ankyrin repeat protein
MLKWLIKNGANINHQDRNGLSSLHGATIYGNIEVIKLLLENDADQNIVDAYGNNPLWTATHWACLKASTENNYKIVEELLKSGSNPHNKNLNGKTPFERSEGNPAIRQLFNKFIGENIGKL